MHHDFMPVAGQFEFRRNLALPSERDKTLADLERDRAIQCYAWLVPLMSTSIRRAVWIVVGPPRFRKTAWVDALALVKENLSRAFERFEPIIETIITVQLDDFPGALPKLQGPLILSVDLDAFSGVGTQNDSRELCTRIVRTALELLKPTYVTVAISRNYLKSDDEAYALLKSALE